MRRCNAAGAAVFVTRRGAAEAGAIFIVVDRLNGELDLYAPAPQAVWDEGRPEDRRFDRVVERASADVLGDRLVKEQRFDSDLWIVTIEDREDRSFLEDG